MQLTHHWKIIKSLVCTVLVAVILGGCAAKGGNWLKKLLMTAALVATVERNGDWKEELIANYYIFEVNTCEIYLVRKNVPDGNGYSAIIPNYYITAYWTNDRYIGAEGIETQDLCISEEELQERDLRYYLIDTTNGAVSGPFETIEDFESHCRALGVEVPDDWFIVHTWGVEGSADPNTETD